MKLATDVRPPRARVALIGLGAVAHEIHVPALRRHPLATLIAGTDLAKNARQRFTRVAPGARLYADAETMLKEERPDIVVIATPPHTHHSLCLLALSYGADILCEKPFVGNLAEADEVIAIAEAADRRVVVNHQYRYLDFFREPARQLHAGAFGRLYYASAHQRMFLLPEQESGWRSELRRRVLFEFGMHVLDLLTFFFESEPVAVSARTPQVLTDDPTDALVVLRLDYPGDRVASVVLNRISRAATRYLDLCLECDQAAIDIHFGGVAEASIGWSRERHRPIFRMSLARGGEAWVEANGRTRRLARQAREGRPGATASLITSMVTAAAAGVEPPVSARYARGLMRAVSAAYTSADRGGELVRL